MYLKASSKRTFFVLPYRTFATKEYDLAVIGGGPGGYVSAIKASQKGLKTVCIEGRGQIGGTCLNVGCIPSKALLNSTHKFHDAQTEFKKHGINFKELSYDFGAMMKKKEAAVKGLTSGIETFLFKKYKVDYIKGWGKFASANQIDIDLSDGKTESIKVKNVIIATGSEPNQLPGNVIPIDEVKVVTSTGALSLKEVPKKMVIIGGGVIGLEMGQVYNRLGTEVTVVEFADKICGFLDNEVSTTFKKILEKQGIKFMLGTKVTGGDPSGATIKVDIEPSKGGAK